MKISGKLWNSFNIALSMYSRLPAAQCQWTEENETYVLCFFPVVGIAIGLFSYLWVLLSGFLSMRAALRTVILMVLPVLVSGGIHLDGFLDTCDALSSCRGKEERVRILKDPHTGAFALIWGIVYFLLLYGILDSLSGRMVWVYLFCFVISRSLSAISVVSFPKFSSGGTVTAFSRNASDRTTRIVCACFLFSAAVCMFFIQPVYAGAAIFGALLAFVLYYRCAMHSFGGINGDLAGFFLSLCELLIPLCIVAVSFITG